MMPDIQNLKQIKDISHKSICFCVAETPLAGLSALAPWNEGGGIETRVVTGASDFQLYEVDISEQKLESREFGPKVHESYVTGVVCRGNTIISGGYDGKLIWWDRERRSPVKQFTAHDKWIRRISLSPDGQLVASVADDMSCKVWSVNDAKLVHDFRGHETFTPQSYPSMLFAVAFSSDGKFLATGDKVGLINVWEIATAQKVAEYQAPGMYTWDPKQRRHSIGGIRSLAFSQDGKLLAAGGIGRIGNVDHLDGPARIEIFNVQTQQRIHELQDSKLKGLVEQLEFIQHDKYLVSTGGDHSGFITIYDVEQGKIVKQEKAHSHVHGMITLNEQTQLILAHHGKISYWALS